jgi:hypothetical protein
MLCDSPDIVTFFGLLMHAMVNLLRLVGPPSLSM